MKPRLRTDIVAGPHPDDEERWLVFCSRTGEHFEFPRAGWLIAERFDGTRTIGDVQATLTRSTSLVMPEAVPPFVERLEEMGLLEKGAPAPSTPLPRDPGPQWTVTSEVDPELTIVAAPGASFTCAGAGTCCASGYVISLDDGEVERLRRLPVLPDEDPICLLPRSNGAPWTWALSNDPACPFLSADQRCQIHETTALPRTCSVFPLAFVIYDDRAYASVTHRCVCGTLGAGEPLQDQTQTLREKLELTKYVPVLPEETRLDAFTRADTAQVVEALLEASTLAPPRLMLRNLVERLRMIGVELDVGGDVADLRALRQTLAVGIAESELSLACALTERPHPNASLIDVSLQHFQADASAFDLEAEVSRFLRDYLSGLRLYRFGSVAAGVFAALLAVDAIMRDDPGHAVGRSRIMLWEDALLSPLFRRLLAADGPGGRFTASLANVARHLEHGE